MIRLSKVRYLITTVGCATLWFILVLAGNILNSQGLENIGVPLIFIAFPICIYSVTMGMLLIYRMWQSIQDGYARTTPGKAVGFLFIPYFNFYWIFQALWGFAKDCNRYIERHQIPVRKLPEGLSLAFCILGIFWFLLLPIVICLIIGFFLVNRACDTVNQLPQPSHVAPQVKPPEFEEKTLPAGEIASYETREVKEKRKLTRKQTLILGIVVTIVVIATGIAASSWFVLTIGIALLIYTLFISMKKKE